ncbi:MAG: peptidoglycan DD-metalloendopeptidase family protein [Burkholderiales bacterium]
MDRKNIVGNVALGLCGLLIAGCAAIPPAPVSERAQPPKPGAKPPVPPAVAARPDPGVVATPLPPSAAVGPTYTVRQGDTLFSIAKANGVDYRELAAWNNIDPASIKVGQQLRLTPPGGVATAPIKPLPGGVETRPLDGGTGGAPSTDPNLKTQPLAQRVPYSDDAYARMAKLQPKPDVKSETKPEARTESPLAAGEVDWSWPTAGKVIANFNDGSNKGVVIAGKLGQPVHASAAGRVIFSGTGIRGLGKLVVIRHNANYLSVYAHNNTLLVKEGQNVGKGQRIAEMGNSDADQVKLHFEIRRQGKPVDPVKLLPPV